MVNTRRCRWMRMWIGVAALASVAGCLAGVRQNLDLVLAPDATANLLRLTTSPLIGLTQVLARLL